MSYLLTFSLCKLLRHFIGGRLFEQVVEMVDSLTPIEQADFIVGSHKTARVIPSQKDEAPAYALFKLMWKLSGH